MNNISTIIETCPQCNNKLEIPVEIYKQIKESEKEKHFNMSRLKAYDGFLVSPCALFYCDHTCYSMFLED